MAEHMDNSGAIRVVGVVGGVAANVNVTNFPAVYPVNDNGGSLTVDGAVSVSNFPAVYPVNDNGGSLTVDDGGATLSVDDGGGSLTVDGSVSVSNFPAVQPVSDNGATLSVDDGGGSLTVDGAVSVSNFPSSLSALSNFNFDAHGRSRSSDSQLVQRVKANYLLDSPYWTYYTAEGVGMTFNYDTGTRLTRIGAATGGTGTVTCTTHSMVNFDMDSSYLCFASFVQTNVSTNSSTKIGWYDPYTSYCQCGVTLNIANSDISWNFHYNQSTGAGSTSNVAQASWNMDVLDGTGASGLTIDVTKFTTICFDIQNGYSGRIRCGFVLDGQIVWAHYFDRTNETTTLLWSSSTLPFCIQHVIANPAGDVITRFRECAVVKEGGPPITPKFLQGYNYATNITAGTTAVHAFTIRPKTTLNAIPNRRQLVPKNLTVSCNTQSCTALIYTGVTFSGAPTYGAADSGLLTFSGYEVGTGGTTPSYTSAIFHGAFRCIVNTLTSVDLDDYFDLVSMVPITLSIMENAVALKNTFTVMLLGDAASATCRISMTWAEYE